MFPNGWPGRGLLILRVGVSALLLHDGAGLFAASVSPLVDSLTAVAALAGVLLLLGLWTPISGILVAFCCGGLLVCHAKDPSILLLEAFTSIALALLGPGIRSIDAVLFGRRRIDLPEK